MSETKIICGDCLEVMRGMGDCSVDAVVTDPPYGLKFMGKDWDYGIPGVAFWAEVLRVAKPGCHLLAFGGTRTFHRLACAIEDAGWEIRDCVMWVYGSGFPKSHDVSKAIDRAARAEWFRINASALRQFFPSNSYWDWTDGGHSPSDKWWNEIKSLADGKHLDRDVISVLEKSPGWFASRESYSITTPATDAARKWNGWGTALKPSYEPVILARKPLAGTVAENVQKFGTGALNIDGCRVGTDGGTKKSGPPSYKQGTSLCGSLDGSLNGGGCEGIGKGRWPANLIHDGSEEVVGLFPDSKTAHITKPSDCATDGTTSFDTMRGNRPARGYDGSGSAARFFYCAKASRKEREMGCDGMEVRDPDQRSETGKGSYTEKGIAPSSNHHPTVKPVALMRYFCRLVTPPGGTVLDPFCGSGSTGIAAKMEGFNFIGIEKETEYCAIAEKRIAAVLV